MKEIYFIRHAESDFNILGDIIGGRSNHIDLTQNGCKQADALGQYFLKKGIDFDKVFSSVALRAKKTAEIVLSVIDYPLESIEFSSDILELSQGDREGVSRKLMYTSEMLEKIRSDNWNFKAPNGESQKDVEDRMLKFLNEKIICSEQGEKFAVFSHGMAIKCMIRGILDSKPNMTYYMTVDNTSITKILVEGDIISLNCINSTPHL